MFVVWPRYMNTEIIYAAATNFKYQSLKINQKTTQSEQKRRHLFLIYRKLKKKEEMKYEAALNESHDFF